MSGYERRSIEMLNMQVHGQTERANLPNTVRRDGHGISKHLSVMSLFDPAPIACLHLSIAENTSSTAFRDALFDSKSRFLDLYKCELCYTV